MYARYCPCFAVKGFDSRTTGSAGPSSSVKVSSMRASRPCTASSTPRARGSEQWFASAATWPARSSTSSSVSWTTSLDPRDSAPRRRAAISPSMNVRSRIRSRSCAVNLTSTSCPGGIRLRRIRSAACATVEFIGHDRPFYRSERPLTDASRPHRLWYFPPARCVSSPPSRAPAHNRRPRSGVKKLRHPGEQRCQCRRGFTRRLDDQSAAGGAADSQTGHEALNFGGRGDRLPPPGGSARRVVGLVARRHHCVDLALSGIVVGNIDILGANRCGRDRRRDETL